MVLSSLAVTWSSLAVTWTGPVFVPFWPPELPKPSDSFCVGFRV